MKSLFTDIDNALTFLEGWGWASKEKAYAMACGVVALRPQIVCEIGVYSGRCSIPIALALKHVGSGVLWAIDPWSAVESAKGQDEVNATWWSQADHEKPMQKFLEAVKIFEVQKHVAVMRKTSDQIDPPSCDILIEDGNHGPQALRDARRFGRQVRVGGLAFLDDLKWSGGHVAAALDELRELGFVEIYRVENNSESWACLQRLTKA